MKTQYITPFITASYSVIGQTLNMKAEAGQIAMQPGMYISQQCNILTGVTGSVEGHVMYGMSLQTAHKIASLMMGRTMRYLDHMGVSAISELGNMITGNASNLLMEAGFFCDITPPSIVRGNNLKISTPNVPALVVPLCLSIGVIEVMVCLDECM